MTLNVGHVCYCTDQGLAYLAWDFYRAGVVQQTMMVRHPKYPNHPGRYPDAPLVMRDYLGSNPEDTARFLDGLDAVIFYETPFDWKMFAECRRRGVKTVLVTMYEWFPLNPSDVPDAYLCPSLLDLEYFPPEKSRFIPVPASPDIKWNRRGTITRYLHNAGHIGSRNHKGTEELLRALPLVKSPIELTIRCQDGAGLNRLMRSVGYKADPRLEVETGTIPYTQLFDEDHDCYVAPEKYNGLSLPLQEAHAAGMVVLTTDRFPANSWLQTYPMVKPIRIDNVRVSGGYVEIDECVVDPADLAAKIDELYGQDGRPWSDLGRAWAEFNSWANLKPKYMEYLEEVCRSS